MTDKGKRRKARKEAHAEGKVYRPSRLVADDRGVLQEVAGDVVVFSETPKGYKARETWARYYDSLDGAPEGDWDR